MSCNRAKQFVIYKRQRSSIRTSSSWKIGEVREDNFLFLKSGKKRSALLVLGKGDDLGMKVPARLVSSAKESYASILKDRLPNLL